MLVKKEKEKVRRKPQKMARKFKKGTKQEKPEENKEKESGMDARMLGAILTGVNRAFPYVHKDEVDPLLERHTPSLFKMIHGDSFNVSVQALMLLFQLKSSQHAVSDRFYRALYAVLLSVSLLAPNRLLILFVGE